MTLGPSAGRASAAYGRAIERTANTRTHIRRRVDLPAGCWAAAEPGTFSDRRSVFDSLRLTCPDGGIVRNERTTLGVKERTIVSMEAG